MHELIAWCFHSPRRLLVVGVASVALLLSITVAVQATRSSDNPVSGRSAPGVAAVADTKPAVDAAVEFTRRWARLAAGQNAAQWRLGLADRVTSELAAGLALTDPASLPGGVPTGQPVVRFVSASSALIEVPLSTGRHILVTVVLSGDRWLARDVQPLEGNAGDVPVVSAAAGG